MEILKELHDTLVTAYDASFDSAYKHMESYIDALVRETNSKESMAREVHIQQETKIRELQHDITVLQTELQRYEVDPQDLELPRKYANLATEFDPKYLWDNVDDSCEIRTVQRRVEAKYIALYTSLQTFIQTWSGLKARVLQHKKKLRLWDQQLGREEFSLILHGQSVRFRRVQSPPFDNVDAQPLQDTHGPSKQCPDLPEITTGPFLKRAHTDDVGITDDHRRPRQIPASEPASPQASPSRPDSDPSGTSCLEHNNHSQKKRWRLSPAIPSKDAASVQQTGISPRSPAVVKTENLSSSPIRTSMHRSQQPFMSTQDLDEIGPTIRTPMKRKAQDVYTPGTLDSARMANNAHRSNDVAPDHQISRRLSILQSANGNKRRAKFPTQASSSQRLEDLEHRGIPALAEDGDGGTPSRNSFKVNSAIGTEPPNTGSRCDRGNERLANLLERSMPSRSPLHSSTKLSIAGSTQTARATGSDNTAARTPNPIVPDIDPDDEPFRARPVSCLGLEHFKINPARNQGLDYAYDTVIRKKDDRKCISGCTRPGCCGDRFRAMIRLGGLPAQSGLEQEEEDQTILREFVGDNSQMLRDLSGRERDNLLVEAKTRLLANKYGRHRHTHQRAQSPPGFWRTDMPDTQEIEHDLEAAKRLEREKVEERYREAMRPGGLWTWADE